MKVLFRIPFTMYFLVLVTHFDMISKESGPRYLALATKRWSDEKCSYYWKILI